jgi:hypothetical protein
MVVERVGQQIFCCGHTIPEAPPAPFNSLQPGFRISFYFIKEKGNTGDKQQMDLSER